MGTYLTAKQIADGIKRFLATAEQALNSSNIQVRYHGTALADVAVILQRLKEQLLYDNRYLSDFPKEFVTSPNGGIELLLRTLGVLQRQLHEAQVQQQNRFTSLLHRSSTTKRRKAGVAEADCLECLKLLLQKTASWKLILDHITNLEILLISITSPQLDSKCYALELVTLGMDQPGGFNAVFKALTSLAGKNRDDSRLTLIVAQLRHGLNTSKLHIQILIVRLLNKLIAHSPSLNHRCLMQIEAENAGFIAENVEQIAAQHGRTSDAELLRREILIWKHAYLPLIWLEKKAQEATGVFPTLTDFPRYSNPVANGDVFSYPRGGPYSSAPERDSELDSKADYSQDEDGTWRGKRMYETNKGARHSNAPVARGLRKKKVGPEGEKKRPNSFAYDSEFSGMVHPSQQEYLGDRGSFLPPEGASSNTTIPRPRAKLEETRPYDLQEGTARRVPRAPYAREHNDSFGGYRTADTGADFGRMKRARSENALFFNENYGQLPARERVWADDTIPRDANDRNRVPVRAHTLERDGTGGLQRSQQFRREPSPPDERLYHPMQKVHAQERSAKGRSMSLHDLHRESEKAAGRNVPIQVMNAPPTEQREGQFVERNPSPPRSPTRRLTVRTENLTVEPNATLPSEPESAIRRSQSDAADRAKIQGFSYLFPHSPTLENIPVRRANSPNPIPGAQRRQSDDSQRSRGSAQSSPPRHQNATLHHLEEPPMPTVPEDSLPDGHVIYIPVRLEGTDQVIQRPHKSIMKQPTSNQYAEDGQSLRRVAKGGGSPRKMRREGSSFGDDVEDALRKFDYLNEYDSSSRGSRYGAY